MLILRINVHVRAPFVCARRTKRLSNPEVCGWTASRRWKKWKKNLTYFHRTHTNGLGSLIHGKDITPLLQGKIDTVSISLNTPNAEEYYKLTRNKFGIESFQAMLDFAKEATKYVPEVVMTTVETTITKEEEQECQKICDSLGVRYRIRPFED